MSKMSEMSTIIEDLHRSAAAISDAANWLAELFSGDEPKPETASTRAINARR